MATLFNGWENYSDEPYYFMGVDSSIFYENANVIGSAGMWMAINANRTITIDFMSNRPINGTVDWKKYENILDVPNNTISLLFGVFLAGDGQIWVNQFEFNTVDESQVLTTNYSVYSTNATTYPGQLDHPINLFTSYPVTTATVVNDNTNTKVTKDSRVIISITIAKFAIDIPANLSVAQLSLRYKDSGFSFVHFAWYTETAIIFRLFQLPHKINSSILLSDEWYSAGDEQYYIVGVDSSIFYENATGTSGFVKSDPIFEGRLSNFFGTMAQRFFPRDFLGKRLRLTSFVKSNNVTGWAGMWMRIDTNITQTLDNMYYRPITGTVDWKKYESILDVPNNTVSLLFGVLLSGDGEVWFNQFEFNTVDESQVLTTNYSVYPINGTTYSGQTRSSN
ncbi:3631_t:CDS:10 [Diversispora eburnea]|uniref:3631_t:CDS:1 n=1 Tax=Diversispora eburnea TaxID=1213867 RepID=A0A9N8ZV00_9GLOM|nr:3631_t:CDS:10 [Diversispora eburnea]